VGDVHSPRLQVPGRWVHTYRVRRMGAAPMGAEDGPARGRSWCPGGVRESTDGLVRIDCPHASTSTRRHGGWGER
jgi:hypothetical protein